ncbi:MAG: 2TM domain-containing protein [Opitutales bacterium]
MSRAYSREEIDRIIRRAQKKQGSEGVNHEELLAMAGELGLEPAALEEAIAEETDAKRISRAKAERQRRRRQEFKRHLMTFVVTMTFLFAVDLLSRGPFWFQWPLLGWGVAVAFHYLKAYHPSDEELEEERD